MGEILLLLLILMFLAFLMRADFIIYVIYVTIGIYLFSYFYPRRMINNLRISRDHHLRAFLGETKWVTITIENTSRFPIPWLEARESIPPELPAISKPDHVIRLSGKESRTLSYQIKGLKRGYYRIGPLRASSGDLFGFGETTKTFEPSYLTIYPRIIKLPNLNLSSRVPFGSLRSDQPLFEDPARPIGVRNFVQGDSLRHINWKVSAHNDSLLVKTYEPAISLETMLLLNLNRSEYSGRYPLDTAEWSITVAASLAVFLSDQRQSVGFATNGADPFVENGNGKLEFDKDSGRLNLPGSMPETKSEELSSVGSWFGYETNLQPRSGRLHLMNLLERMARIELTDSTPLYEWVIKATHQLPWGVTLLIVSPTANEFVFHSLNTLRQSGYNPFAIITEPYLDFSRPRRLAESYKIPIYHIFDEKSFSNIWSRGSKRIPLRYS